MICFIEYFMIKRRVKFANQTIKLMGDNCPTQLLAQRDMLLFELQWNKEKSTTFLFVGLILLLASAPFIINEFKHLW